LDDETGALTLMAVNRSTSESLDLTAVVRAFPQHRIVVATQLAAAESGDTSATNTAAAPDAVVPVRNPQVRLADGLLEVSLPPVSWNLIRLEPAPHATPLAR
jgi:alpha-N-arabinofuranosidase